MLDERTREALATQIDYLPDGVPADADTTSGLVTPSVDTASVAYARCELTGCALNEVEVHVPYSELPGLVTPLLQSALDGPVASGN